MKLKKILAAVAASVMAVGTMAVGASATTFYVPEGIDPSLSIGGGNWLIQLYNTGNPDENKPAVDRGLDVTKVASMTAYVELVPADDSMTLEDYDAAMDGGFGGAMIWSANGGEYGTSNADELYKKYNWPNSFNNWWGLPEKDDTFEGRPEDQGGANTNTGTANWEESIVLKYIRRFGYSLTLDIPDDYRWIPGAGCHQVGVQVWSGGDYFNLKVDAYTVNDDEGNILLAFDELGNEIDETKLKSIVDELSKPVVDEPGGDTPSNTNDGSGENTAANEENTAATEGNTSSNDSNTNTTPSTTTAAPSSSSGNSNTGLIIGIIAGVVAVIVVVVIIIIKKKK